MSGPTGVPDFDFIIGSRPWLDRAGCLGTDPNLWFKNHKGKTFGKEVKAICASCPVKQECLDWVLGLSGDSDPGGFVAGMNARQRLIARRERRRRAS